MKDWYMTHKVYKKVWTRKGWVEYIDSGWTDAEWRIILVALANRR